jgi:hypothetical protein
MKNVVYNIEDCLELLVGLKGQGSFQIESSDQTILQSIARQVSKGVALTDRQYELVKQKLLTYKAQFSSLEYNIDLAIDTLRMPLREIDRDKFITVVGHRDTLKPNEAYESYKEKWKWIKVRFPFSKKLILTIENINAKIPRSKYHHNKGTHEHYFFLSEKTIYEVVGEFKDKNFNIDEQLLSIYEKLETMKNNKEEYIPGVYNFKLRNLNDRAVNYMISSVGEPSIETLALYKDRQDMFGLHYFDQSDLEQSIAQLSTLTKKIVNRKRSNVFVQHEKYTINAVAESILELNRFPLIVILPTADPLSYLHIVHTAFNGFIDNQDASVLFRLDNKTNSEFNDYIKKHSLNSPLDSSTKIVYISNDNVPKPLLMSNWKPSAALMLSSSRNHSRVGTYCETLDLVIHYDKEPSVMLRRNLDIL